MIDLSPAERIADEIVERYGVEGAHREVDALLDEVSNVDLTAHDFDWSNLWARSKQVAPAHDWQSWGFLCGRGFGKTLSVSKHINREVHEGRAKLIGIAAQDESSAIDIQINGPSGLIATAPPWFRPQWEATALQLVWPNGARAYVRTPEVPGKIRGLEYHLSWLTELQSWPKATRDEAYMNFVLATRLGYARIVWDATPKRGHPLIKKLLAGHNVDPKRHVVVRGSTHENAANLGNGYIDKLEAEMGGTARGREELLGEMLDETDNALVKQEWIDAVRRPMPDKLVRQVLGIDPAVTNRAGNDRTGIVEAGLGVDAQVYVLGDYSGRMSADAWATIVLDRYVEGRCDCVVVETNKGGDLVTQNLRAAAGKRNLSVVVLGKTERSQHVAGVVYVREVHARGEKADRAQPLATAYERSRVSHVNGVDLTSLEETLTTWEPTPGSRSPDALDALVHAVVELLGLLSNRPAPEQSFKGIERMGAELASPARVPKALVGLFGRGSGGKI